MSMNVRLVVIVEQIQTVKTLKGAMPVHASQDLRGMQTRDVHPQVIEINM